MASTVVSEGNIIISRTSDINNAKAIHDVLFDAFMPYRKQYTEAAFNATVISEENLKKRISDKVFDVLIAFYNSSICGTASVKVQDKDNLYLAGMAVKPGYYGKGIGHKILNAAEETAMLNGCSKIILETSAPLLNAIKLYGKFGFKRTGKSRDYFGINIFEMMKTLE